METKYYYHKCTADGLINLISNPTDEPLCVSTDNCHSLFWRDVVVVIDADQAELLEYSTDDIDSRSGSDHDEARISFNPCSVKHVIMDGKKLNRIKKGTYEFRSALNIKSGPGRDRDKAQQMAAAEIAKNMPMCNLSQAKKINKSWNKEFLNI